MKRLLLLCTIFNLPAFVPPQKPTKGKSLPTFEQVVSQKEMSQQRMQQATLEGLPAELRREILLVLPQSGGMLNIPKLAQGITSLAATNKTLHALVNNPQNMLIILKSLPISGAVVLAEGLRNMPGMKSNEVKEWLKETKDKLESGQELYEEVAAGSSNISNIKRILQNPNINLNWKGRNAWTALRGAINQRHIEIVKLLLDAGANVNAKDKFGQTPLIAAIADGYTKVSELLLSAGADVNARGQNHETALMVASRNGNIEMVELLLAAGANVNAAGEYGWTPLLWASDRGHPGVVRLLLAAGADPFALRSAWESAHDLAQQNAQSYPRRADRYNEVIKLLEDAKKAQSEKRRQCAIQ